MAPALAAEVSESEDEEAALEARLAAVRRRKADRAARRAAAAAAAGGGPSTGAAATGAAAGVAVAGAAVAGAATGVTAGDRAGEVLGGDRAAAAAAAPDEDVFLYDSLDVGDAKVMERTGVLDANALAKAEAARAADERRGAWRTASRDEDVPPAQVLAPLAPVPTAADLPVPAPAPTPSPAPAPVAVPVPVPVPMPAQEEEARRVAAAAAVAETEQRRREAARSAEDKAARAEAKLNARVNAHAGAPTSPERRRALDAKRDRENAAAAAAAAAAASVGVGFEQGGDAARDPAAARDDYMRTARALREQRPVAADTGAGAVRAVFDHLDRVQMVAWNSRVAGQFLVDDGALDDVCAMMRAHRADAGVQERGVHAIIRLIRAADAYNREALIVAHSAREFRSPSPQSQSQSQSQSQQATGGSSAAVAAATGTATGSAMLNPVKTVVEAMLAHPEIMTVQLAGCNVLASFMSVGHVVRQLFIDYGGERAVVDSLRVRGRAAAFERLYYVHEMATRAICELCRGEPAVVQPWKDAVGEVQGVEQVVACISRWTLRDGLPREARTTVTRHACAALRYLTKDHHRNGERALDAKALLVLVRVLEANSEYAPVCLSAVAAMGATAVVDGEAAAIDLEESNALPCLVGIIRRHADNSVLVRKGLQCIRLLCSFGPSGPESRRRIIELGAVDTCMAPMCKYADDAAVQEHACGALAVLCRDEPVAKDLAARGSIASLLTAALTDHGDNVLVVEQASHAVASTCAQHPGSQDAARHLDTCGALVRVLRLHSATEPVVAISVSSAIRVLSLSQDPALSERLLGLFAPEMLLETMKAHRTDPKVQEHASFALSAMCAKNDSLPKRIARGGAVQLLVSLLREYMEQPNVVYAIMCAIRSMVSKSREVVFQFIVCKLPDLLHNALVYHMPLLPQNDHVMIVLCATINVCGFKVVTHKNELGGAGLVEQLRELMTLSSEKGDESVLRPTLSTLCTLLINAPDNQDRFQEVDGVEAVLYIVQKWSRNETVVEHCCVVIRHSCGEHDGNRDEIKANNGIRTLQGVLRSHPDSPGVVTAACQALAVICHGDSELQTAAGMLDTIPSTVTAMNHFEDVATVQAGACSFLFAVTQNNARNKLQVVRRGGRTAIVRAIEKHPGNEDVSNYGGHALMQVQDIAAGPQSASQHYDDGADRDEAEALGPSPASPSSRLGGAAGGAGGLFSAFTSRRRSSRDARPVAFPVNADGSSSYPQSTPALEPIPQGYSRSKFPTFRKPRAPRASLDQPRTDEDPALLVGNENEAPEMHELDGGTFPQPAAADRTQEPLGPSPVRSRASRFWPRSRSKSSLGSSSKGSVDHSQEHDSRENGEHGSGIEAEDGAPAPAPGRRQSRRRLSFIRRSSATRRRSLDVRHDGIDGVRLDAKRREERRTATRQGVDWVATGPGEDDNDIARIEDLDGLSLVDDGFAD